MTLTPGNPRYRFLYTVWAFLECLGFGGLIYGWGSLVFVLKDEGLYLDLCPQISLNETSNPNSSTVIPYMAENESISTANSSFVIYAPGSSPAPALEAEETGTSCKKRDSQLNLVFTIGSAMFCVGCFVMGQVNFKFGTRISRIGAALLFIAGALMLAFTSNDVPWLAFPGLSLIGAGGITYLMTNMQISNLFPTRGSLIIGLFCGGFDASSGIQLMIKMGYENGISRQTSYIILACAHCLTLISTFLFLPKDYIKKPSPRNTPDDVADDKEAAVELTGVKGKDQPADGEEKKGSLLSYLLSPIYVLHVLWLSILQLRFYFFLGSLNSTLEKILETKDDVSHYTNVQMYVLMCGLFTSPFAGAVCDFFTRLYVRSRSPLRRVLMPTVVPLAITTTLCIGMSAFVLIPEPEVMYAVYIFLLFFRSFMYTMAAGYISAIFPSEYFGSLYGILIITGGIISLFQNALFSWAKATDFMQVNIFLLGLMLTTYGHPLFQWYTCRKAERSHSLVEGKE